MAAVEAGVLVVGAKQRHDPGDVKLFLAWAEVAVQCAKWLAPFQSRKLRPVAVAEAPSEIREETSFTCSDFSAWGEQVSEIMNGQAAEGSDETAPAPGA